MPGASDQPLIPEVPEERRFVWRNLEAYLAGELAPADRRRIEDFLGECAYTREYVETERQFIELLRRCVNEPSAPCPEGLEQRVRAALDRCESEMLETEPPRVALRLPFPWLGAGFLTAASLMLVAALLLFGREAPPASSLPTDLAPLVASVSMDVPRSERCRYRDALEGYRRHFADGPELPRMLNGRKLRVSEWHCAEVDGRRVMCATYDAPDGGRFGLMVFRCNCLEKAAPQEMKAVEVELNGKLVLLWREGDYFRALVGDDDTLLRQHMNELRGTT
jgi:hypothetical protein